VIRNWLIVSLVLRTRKQKDNEKKLKQKAGHVDQYRIREGSSVDVRWVERIYGGKDLWKRYVLSLEWKRVGVMDGESGGDGACEKSS